MDAIRELLRIARTVLSDEYGYENGFFKRLNDMEGFEVSEEKSSIASDKKEKPIKHTPLDKPRDLSGGRTRGHRYLQNAHKIDVYDWDTNKKDYRNIDIAQNLPLGNLSPTMEKVKSKLSKKHEDISDKMLHAIQVHDSVVAYTEGRLAANINDVEHHRKKPDSTLRQHMEDLDNFIAYTPKFKGDTLYRGGHLKTSVLNKLKKGSILSRDKVLSTASSKQYMTNFVMGGDREKATLFIIHGAKGVSVTDFSRADQKEVLLPRNCKLKVEKIEYKRMHLDSYEPTDVVQITLKAID